jgi:hypothetical protein
MPSKAHTQPPHAAYRSPRSRHKPDFGGGSKRRVAQDIVKDIAKIAPAARPKSGCDWKQTDKYGASMAAAADRACADQRCAKVARRRPCNLALINFRINAALFRADA